MRLRDFLRKKCHNHSYNDFEVFVNCIEAEDVDSIVDFIGKRLNDVTY